MIHQLSLNWFIAFVLFNYTAIAYTPLPRWGQASALMQDVLYVQGGKTDQYNAYSYTAAPNVNDLLSLDLSSSFQASSPPWNLVSSLSNASTSQGPAVAWHTLSGLNSSFDLAFGGTPSPDAASLTLADSAWLLNIHTASKPQWQHEPTSWAGEPARRIHHTAVTINDGQVFIFGGETPDGSDVPITAHYIFNPYRQTFTQLPTENGPSDITGHGSCILSNGTIVVFGGYQQSTQTLNPFSSIWAIETSIAAANVSWTSMTVSSSTLPQPRRAFAVTCFGEKQVLIHGGSDASFQQTYGDGWVIDFSQDPPAWVQVDALSAVGVRRDHFAVSAGSSIIFGFGYGESGPYDGGMVIYNPSSSSTTSSYTPPPATSSPTQTMPGSSQTSSPSSRTMTGTVGIVTPSTTVGPGGGGSGGGGGGSGNPAGNDNSSNGNSAAIAIGTTLGVLAALVIVVVAVWYVRRNRDKHGRFSLLHDRGDSGEGVGQEESPQSATFAIPVAGHFEKGRSWPILRSIGIGAARHTPERRDMLADEDTRVFTPRYERSNGSSWSLRSILGGGRRTREASAASSLGTPWGEKTDPFSDSHSLLRDLEIGAIPGRVNSGSSRPSGRRQYSHNSSLSAHSYRDPFSDPILEEDRGDDDGVGYSYSDLPPPPRLIQTGLPLEFDAHILSPVTEASRQSLNAPSSASSQSHETLNPFDSSSRVTSMTSYDGLSPRSSSLVDAAPKPVRRSDSWWARFARTSLLDRRGSGSSRHMLDFRDPNPPPRLVAIEESTHSVHSNSPESGKPSRQGSGDSRKSSILSRRSSGPSRRVSKVYGGGHGKSASSVRTADSDAIEKMAGHMDIAQRLQSGSKSSRDTSGSDDIHDPGDSILTGENLVTSPVDAASFPLPPSLKSGEPSPPISSAISSTTSLSSAGTKASVVADRIREYERRMSQDMVTPPPTNTRAREDKSHKTPRINYGFVPRASLYVANPDHRHSSSSDS